MTQHSSLQSTNPRIHTSHCGCKQCAPIKLAGDPANFGKDASSSWLPDPPYALAMVIIGTVGLITHLIMFS
jgi:hypothetical protein